MLIVFDNHPDTKEKIMSNDTTVGTVELVRTETTGYLNENGEFVYGTPPAEQPKEMPTYVQTGEDAD